MASSARDPSALFVFQALLEKEWTSLAVEIFEAADRLDAGIPYGPAGANVKHVTNVSGNEIPPLAPPLVDWLPSSPPERLKHSISTPNSCTIFKVVPRLLFGEY